MNILIITVHEATKECEIIKRSYNLIAQLIQ